MRTPLKVVLTDLEMMEIAAGMGETGPTSEVEEEAERLGREVGHHTKGLKRKVGV